MAPSPPPPNTTTYKLSSGYTMPALGFGTWAAGTADERDGVWCKESTLAALRAGYRHIDTAKKYLVERPVGEAIRESGVPREEVFVTTKFWNHLHAPEDVAWSLDQSLADLGLEYVDMYLMHWPIAFHRTSSRQILTSATGAPVIDPALTASHVATWRAMEALVDAGKARSIGVSNFSVAHLAALLPHVRIPIAANQVEAHPWWPNNELLGFCRERGILLTAYSPLGGQNPRSKESLVDEPTVRQVAKTSGMDVGQVLLSWAVQRGTAVVAKSAKKSRIISNFHLGRLSDADFAAIDDIHKSKTVCLQRSFEEDWGVKIF